MRKVPPRLLSLQLPPGSIVAEGSCGSGERFSCRDIIVEHPPGLSRLSMPSCWCLPTLGPRLCSRSSSRVLDAELALRWFLPELHMRAQRTTLKRWDGLAGDDEDEDSRPPGAIAATAVAQPPSSIGDDGTAASPAGLDDDCSEAAAEAADSGSSSDSADGNAGRDIGGRGGGGGGVGFCPPEYPALRRAQRTSFAMPIILPDISTSEGRQVRFPNSGRRSCNGRLWRHGLMYMRLHGQDTLQISRACMAPLEGLSTSVPRTRNTSKTPHKQDESYFFW